MAQSTNVRDCLSSWMFERDFALRFFEAVGTPVALRQYALLNSGQIDDVVGLKLKPADYQEPEHFAADYQVAELLRKSQSIPGTTPKSRETKARSKFLAAEQLNAITNDRLWGDVLPTWFGPFSTHLLEVLGPLGSVALERIAELGKFGPGVNVGVRGEGLVPSKKYDTKPVCTGGLLPLLPGIMPSMVADFWGSNLLQKTKVVRGNAHFTVPKTWDIDRCAAKEPLWNSFLQLGIGRYIDRRLRRFGVDLHDQTWNQTLAEYAERWKLATIDLSSASDTMSRMVVFLALCYNMDPQGKRWFHLLNLARSPHMNLGGEWRTLEMFASMGNGFTFPLETALFHALVRTVVPPESMGLCAVYGDDIIVPQAYARELIDRLGYLGFKTNGEKTCLAGTFFESCGTDWFNSQNVRPFYLHRDPESKVPYPLQAANALRAWCLRIYGRLPPQYASVWRWCKSQIPTVWRNPIPPLLGDSGLHVGLSEGLAGGCASASSVAAGKCYHQWEGFVVRHVALAPITVDRRSFGVLCCGLRAIGQEDSLESKGLEPLKGLFGRPRTKLSVVLWKDDFSW